MSLVSLKTASKEAADGFKELDKAFTTLDIKRVAKDANDAQAAFKTLADSGKASAADLLSGFQTALFKLGAVAKDTAKTVSVEFFNELQKIFGGRGPQGVALDLVPSFNFTALADALTKFEGIDKITNLVDGLRGRVDVLGNSIKDVAGISALGTANLFQYADAANQAALMSAAIASGDTNLANYFLNAVSGSSHAAEAINNLSRSGVQMQSDLDFSQIGLTSQAELEQLARKAQQAYERIRDSGTAAPLDIERAELVSYDRRRAAGEAFSQTTMAQMENVRLNVQGAIRDLGDSWARLGTQVTHAISNDLSRALGDAVFQTGRLGDAFKRMGQDVVDIVLNKIVHQAIKQLLDSLASVQGIIGKIAGLFGGIAPNGNATVPSNGGVLGTGVGAAGGAAATLGGKSSGGPASNPVNSIPITSRQDKQQTTLNDILAAVQKEATKACCGSGGSGGGGLSLPGLSLAGASLGQCFSTGGGNVCSVPGLPQIPGTNPGISLPTITLPGGPSSSTTGTLGEITKIGGAVTGVVNAGTAIAKAGSAAAGLAGGIGSAVSSLAGLANPIGLVTGAVSAITGVIGAFQQAASNAKLGGIQSAVTRLDIVTTQGGVSTDPSLGGQQENISVYTKFTYLRLGDVLNRIVDLRSALFDPVAQDLEYIGRAITALAIPKIDLGSVSVNFSFGALEGYASKSVDLLGAIANSVLDLSAIVARGLNPALAFSGGGGSVGGSSVVNSVHNFSSGGDTYNIDFRGSTVQSEADANRLAEKFASRVADIHKRRRGGK